ncbi:hypothetical protein CEP52_001024 [Fusarium oligoseptatum]|uniref:C2H2-type domain-containing protein n=1 Tax=Fusarium oligoseptatum TaxID=2604345 RepID=A0A428ULC7_9HYPO|nr:hypothetical protein CEP52_001024 [Fusarium oligoseptatum]
MMMRQSRAYIPRPPDECPLCYYKIPAEDGKNQPQGLVARRQSTFGKRQKGPLQEKGGKTARRAVESSNPEPHQSLDSTVDNSDIESEHSSSSDMPRTPLSIETVARHVASHLQVLMFLTIRMITLQLNTEEAFSDLPGDSVDVDGGSDSSWRNDFETISDIEGEETTKPDSSESVDSDVSPDEEHPFVLPSALGDTDHGRGEVEGMDGWGYIREVIKQEEADTQATTLSQREQTDLTIIEYRYPEATVNLQRHLARSITFRRKRLLDIQSHAANLSTRRRDGRGENSLPSIPESPPTKQENSSKEEGENVTEATHRITLPRSWGGESKVKLRVVELSRSQATVASRRPAYQVEESIDMKYPKPSAIDDGAAYCFYRSIWRRHVNRDIQPYVCLYYTCSTSFFSSYQHWVVHMEGAHGLDWIKNISEPFAWQCPFEQDSRLFNAPDKLLLHLKDFHSMSPSHVPGDCEKWLEDQKVAVPPQQDLCPLCGFLVHGPDTVQEDTVQEDVDSVGSEAAKRVRFGPEPTPRSDVSRQEMSRHIGSHLLSIAFTSLDAHAVEESHLSQSKTMDTDSTIGVLRPSIDDNSGPNTFVLSGQSIYTENAASIPVYQLNREVTSTSQKGTTITFERVEYDGPGEAESMVSVKQRNQHLFYLVHPANAQYRTDLPAYYITSASPDMVGNVQLQASKSLLQKVEFKALLSTGKSSSSDKLFDQDNQETLFEAKPKWKGGQYQWIDSAGKKIAHEEGKRRAQVGQPINLRSSSISAVTMSIHFHGPLPEGMTVHYSRGRTTYNFRAGSIAHMNITGEDIHITPMGGGRRGSGGRNRGQGNRQRRQRRRGTGRVPSRAENQLSPPSQPNRSAGIAKLRSTLKTIKNLIEKVKNGSQAATNTQWGPTEERLTGTADCEASPSTGKATEIESFAKTVETSRDAQTTNAVYPNEFGRAGGMLATGPWDSSSHLVQSYSSFPAGPA